MFKIAKVVLVTIVLVIGVASTPVFAASARGVAAGEAQARELLKLMDTDKSGRCRDRSSCGSWKLSSTAWTWTTTASLQFRSFRSSVIQARTAESLRAAQVVPSQFGR